MRIRLYNRMDLDDVLKLYYDTVHSVCAQDYSLEELDAMAPEKPNIYHWETSLEKNHTIVAVNDEDEIIGFGNIGQTGFLDRLYVDKDYLYQGVASALVKHLENYAKVNGNNIIDTISTISSEDFFKKLGYKTLSEDISELRGERIVGYAMEKKL